MTKRAGLLGWFHGWFRGGAAPGVALVPLDLAAGPVYAVGDVHGCRLALAGLEALIREDATRFPGRPQIVLLGDMVDRGPDTAGLLDDVLRPLPWATRLAIRGNHEEMMLSFLEEPSRHQYWLDQGGYETLRSYGLALDPAAPLDLPLRRLRQMLAAHLPSDHLDWLRALPCGHVVADGAQSWVLAHAGFDPKRGFSDQPARTLVWGGARPNPDGTIRLVHGHVIQTEVYLVESCIGIDTGAYKTGELTTLRLVEGRPPALLSYTAQHS
jgi:serine/threonine protein phosphatase 1